MAEPDYDAIIAESGIARGLTVDPYVRTDVLFARLPVILATVRQWLRGEAGADGSDEALETGETDEVLKEEDVSCTMVFPDAWYRSAVVGVERATEERQQTIADMASRLSSEIVMYGGYPSRAGNLAYNLLKCDGFGRMLAGEPWINKRAYTRALPEIVRYMRDVLGASTVERAVVVTIVRDNIAELVCHPSDDAVAMHRWLVLYESPVMHKDGEWVHAEWTDNQKTQWTAAFKKRFTTPEPYLSCDDTGYLALHRLTKVCSLRSMLYVFGIEVLFRAGIDPAGVVDYTGYTVFETGIFAFIQRGFIGRFFAENVRRVYAEHPEFRFDALLNARNYAGDTIADSILRGGYSSDSNTVRVMLFLCACGLDADVAIAAQSEHLWKSVWTVLTDARAAGLPRNTIIAMIWDAMHSFEPKGPLEIVADTHAVRLRRTCIDIGRKSSFTVAVRDIISKVMASEPFVQDPSELEETIQCVFNTMRCYPRWSPRRHQFHTERHRARVTAVLLCAYRLEDRPTRKCGRLPVEMWLAILAFVPDIILLPHVN